MRNGCVQMKEGEALVCDTIVHPLPHFYTIRRREVKEGERSEPEKALTISFLLYTL